MAYLKTQKITVAWIQKNPFKIDRTRREERQAGPEPCGTCAADPDRRVHATACARGKRRELGTPEAWQTSFTFLLL